MVYNLVQAGRADDSRALMERAGAEVRAAQHPPSETILMLAQDAHAYVEGQFGESLRLHEAAIRRGFGPGEANREWIARHWRCELLANLDRLDESIELAASGIVAAQRGRQAWAIEFFEIYRGRQLLQRGQIADARVALEGRIEPGVRIRSAARSMPPAWWRSAASRSIPPTRVCVGRRPRRPS